MLKELHFVSQNPKEFWDKFESGTYSIATVNPEILVLAEKNPNLKSTLNSTDILTVDGVGLKMGLFLFGKRIHKCTGMDLVEDLIKRKSKLKIYLWGANNHNVKRAAEKLKKKGLTVVGFNSGFNYKENEVIDDIKKRKANIVLLGMNATMTIPLGVKVKKQINITTLTVGGVLDVLAGEYKRAPKLWQKVGLEWLWRIISEPKRINRVPYLIKFVFFAIKERLKIGKV